MSSKARYYVATSSARRDMGFGDLADLAAALHRMRADAGIQCVDAVVARRSSPSGPCVGVWKLGDDGERETLLGYVFGLGRPGARSMLEHALRTARPEEAGADALAEAA